MKNNTLPQEIRDLLESITEQNAFLLKTRRLTVSVIIPSPARNELQQISADYNPGEGEEKALSITLDNQAIPRKFAHYEKEHSQ